MKAASVQFQHKQGDKAFNFERIEHFVKRSANEGAELVCFPEMCITGYWGLRNFSRNELIKLAENVPGGPSCGRLSELAEKYNISIGAGLIELAVDGKMYNTYVVAMPGGELVSHRKLHCFISEHLESGDSFTVFELPSGVKAGILICYDNNIVENVRLTALAGAEVLLAPHQTGGCKTPSPLCMGAIDAELWNNRLHNPKAIEEEFRGPKGRQWLMKWLPARAHDNGLFLIFSNGVGTDHDEVRTGNAMILDCYGNILAEASQADDAMVVADLDMSLLASCTGRRWIKSRRPELYRPIAEATGLEQDTRKVRFNP